MTRINAGIPPACLIDKHLRAEIRELPRVFTAVRKRIDNEKPIGVKYNFCLGPGHVTFFNNKPTYLMKRYDALLSEYNERTSKRYGDQKGFSKVIDNANFVADYFDGTEPEYWPGTEEKELLTGRIVSRIMTMKRDPMFRGKKITRGDAVRILVLCFCDESV